MVKGSGGEPIGDAGRVEPLARADDGEGKSAESAEAIYLARGNPEHGGGLFLREERGHDFPKYSTMLLRVRNWSRVIFPLTIIDAQAFVRPTALPISSKFIRERAHLPVNFLISRMSDVSVMMKILSVKKVKMSRNMIDVSRSEIIDNKRDGKNVKNILESSQRPR